MTFEEIMQQERNYAEMEYLAIRRKDYPAADAAHYCRWKCMDAAIQAVERESSGC